MKKITHEVYGTFCNSLLKEEINKGDRVVKTYYLLTKLFSEAGEVIGEVCKREFHHKPVSKDKLIEEVGDCLWYYYNLIWMLYPPERNTIFNVINNYNFKIRPFDEVASDFISNIGNFHSHWYRCKLNGKDLNDDWPYKNYYLTFFHFIERITFCILDLIGSLNLDWQHIIDVNMAKLTARHGDSYNPSFYTREEEMPEMGQSRGCPKTMR